MTWCWKWLCICRCGYLEHLLKADFEGSMPRMLTFANESFVWFAELEGSVAIACACVTTFDNVVETQDCRLDPLEPSIRRSLECLPEGCKLEVEMY